MPGLFVQADQCLAVTAFRQSHLCVNAVTGLKKSTGEISHRGDQADVKWVHSGVHITDTELKSASI